MGFGALQPMHLLLILAIVLVVFGAGKLGQIGGALGKSVKEFKENVGVEDEQNQLPASQATTPVKTETVKTETRAAAPVATVERPKESLRREEI